jgi:hypothetical protein
MDRKENRKRPIMRSDVVHESVSRRKKIDGDFSANNPPVGLRITGDDGKIRPAGQGFEQA